MAVKTNQHTHPMIKVTIERPFQGAEFTDAINKVFGTVGFWNLHAKSVYQSNIDGKMGNQETQEFARKTEFNTWLLSMINDEMKVFLNDTELKCGRGGSHCWISGPKNDRIVLIEIQ